MFNREKFKSDARSRIKKVFPLYALFAAVPVLIFLFLLMPALNKETSTIAGSWEELNAIVTSSPAPVDKTLSYANILQGLAAIVIPYFCIRMCMTAIRGGKVDVKTFVSSLSWRDGLNFVVKTLIADMIKFAADIVIAAVAAAVIYGASKIPLPNDPHLFITYLTAVIAVCFGIVGLIWVRYSLIAVKWIAVDDHGKGIKDTLATSLSIMKGYRMDMLLLELSYWYWYVVEIATLGIASLYVSPYRMLAEIEAYDEIKRPSGHRR